VANIPADVRGWKPAREFFVADMGINSEDNRVELAKAYGKFLLARGWTVPMK